MTFEYIGTGKFSVNYFKFFVLSQNYYYYYYFF